VKNQIFVFYRKLLFNDVCQVLFFRVVNKYIILESLCQPGRIFGYGTTGDDPSFAGVFIDFIDEPPDIPFSPLGNAAGIDYTEVGFLKRTDQLVA
jgi:hypothetical protein